jgi:hypothetical protein
VPWFVLLAVLGSRARFTAAAERPQLTGWGPAEIAAALLLSAFSVFVNSRAGNSVDVFWWNVLPIPVDFAPQRVWDWRQPQFLAGLTFVPKGCSVVTGSGWERLAGASTQPALSASATLPGASSRADLLITVQDPATAVLRGLVTSRGPPAEVSVFINDRPSQNVIEATAGLQAIDPIGLTLGTGRNVLTFVRTSSTESPPIDLRDLRLTLVDEAVDCLILPATAG